jgi:hypothetical protein
MNEDLDEIKLMEIEADTQYAKHVLSSRSPQCVRWFLFVKLLPAIVQPLVCEKTGGEPRLFADYKGKRVRVTMASRFGDVGITDDLTKEHGYSTRVSVDDLSNFSEEK